MLPAGELAFAFARSGGHADRHLERDPRKNRHDATATGDDRPRRT
jgi:hypothetical protein